MLALQICQKHREISESSSSDWIINRLERTMLATQVTRSKTLHTGSPAKADANRYYEYKLKLFVGWNNITLGMGLSGSRNLNNDLLKSKGKLKLMTRQNYPKNKFSAAQQTSRSFITLLCEIILTKALGTVLAAGLPWHSKDVQFDKHIFSVSEESRKCMSPDWSALL